jgi:hypothetical protein
MGQFAVEGAAGRPHLFVAPIEHLAFERGHPITQDVEVYRKRRTENAAVSFSRENGRRSCQR